MIKSIPVETSRDFRGKPVKTQKLDNDMEKVFKKVSCPEDGCDYTSTSLEDFQAHLESHDDPDIQAANINLIPELIDSDTRYIILDVLQRLSISNPQHPVVLGKVRRAADSLHSAKVWAAVWKAIENDAKEIVLDKRQYEWLHKLLERKLSEKGVKEDERQTMAEQVFGLSWYSAVQLLLTVDERDDAGEDSVELTAVE